MASANDKLYRSADGHAWVGEYFEGRFPSNATHIADLPQEDDSRWRPGVPAFSDVEFITLSPFSPSGRLGVCVEKKSSNPLGQYPNHPAFEGCKAWMPVSETRWTLIPRPEHARYVVMDEHTLGYLCAVKHKVARWPRYALTSCFAEGSFVAAFAATSAPLSTGCNGRTDRQFQ